MKFKDFDETHKCIETGHRVFWVHNDYSHYSDYRVYYNGKKLKYADSLIKMQNKWRIQSKENQNLRKKFYSSEYFGTFMVHKGDDNGEGNNKSYGANVILGGDTYQLKKNARIRIVRKVKNDNSLN